MKPIIKVENLGKQYRLGLVGTGTFAHDVNRWWHTIRGKEDPYLKIGEVNDRASRGKSDYVWALKDINFEVMPGEVVGIIGKNGAGKSTLLKLLSRVTGPTTGSIEARGRIASLLEVGTGFHDELTGRENIFLNGAILGMTKAEITSKLDEIIDFSGTQRYIDTPVKRYSSGMRVRLAFAVAAHLEPEILIVDEVLAVGDAEFQKKAIGKMQEVSQGGGRTVLFVSHNMGSIKALCNRGILLNNGYVEHSGSVDTVIEKYLLQGTNKKGTRTKVEFKRNSFPLAITSAQVLKNGKNTENLIFDFTDKLGFSLRLFCKEGVKNRALIIHCYSQNEKLFTSWDVSVNEDLLQSRRSGEYEVTINFPAPIFRPGVYSFDFEVGHIGVGPEQLEKDALSIEVEILSRNPRFQAASKDARFYVEPEWRYKTD